MSQWLLTGTEDIIPIQTMSQLMSAEKSIPVMIKRMKDFDEHTKKHYGGSMNIPTYQFSSSNMYPEHNYEPSNAGSGDVEYIYVPYEGY